MRLSFIAKHFLLFTVATAMIFPIFWMLLISLHSNPEQYSSFFSLLTSTYSASNYTETLSSDSFGVYFFNSVLIGLLVTIGNVIFCFLCGYSLARKSFQGNRLVFLSLLGVMAIPPQVMMIPLYRIMVQLQWINSYYALIIPWLVTPFGIFLVRQFVATLPADIEDAARLDGASELRIVFSIVMRLCKPILVVLAIYIFLGNWNTFLYPFLFTNDTTHRTLPVGLAFYLGKQSIDWGHLMAGASISALPVLLLFAIFQKQIIKGLTAGALKE